jgi:hypothetical protein
MAETVKLIASEISVTSANTISGASLVRVYASANALITLANTGGTIGTCTMPGGTIEYFVKQPADTIASNVAVLATSVAFT